MAETSMAERLRRVQFLGREFLTWLMFRSKQDDGIFKLDDVVAEVFFERSATLEGSDPTREMTSLKVEDPVHSEEVLLSLRLGKQVSRARLLVLVQGREFSLVLDGPTLGIRSVKLPEPSSIEFEDVMAERAEALKLLEDTIHGLFLSFMRLRLDAKLWAKEALAIRRWLEGSVNGGD